MALCHISADQVCILFRFHIQIQGLFSAGWCMYRALEINLSSKIP